MAKKQDIKVYKIITEEIHEALQSIKRKGIYVITESAAKTRNEGEVVMTYKYGDDTWPIKLYLFADSNKKTRRLIPLGEVRGVDNVSYSPIKVAADATSKDVILVNTAGNPSCNLSYNDMIADAIKNATGRQEIVTYILSF